MSTSIAALVLAVLALASAPRSGADFTASASSPGNHLAAAANFNTVTVSLADPSATLQGTVALTATATSERGIASVRIQSATAGSNSWSDICVRSSAPYQCNWVTSGDGHYDLRAVATDTAGYTQTATVAARTVDNLAPTVALTNPGSYLGGTVTLSATASDAGTGVQDVTIQQRAAGAGPWTDVCTDTTAPYSCSFNTTGLRRKPRAARRRPRPARAHHHDKRNHEACRQPRHRRPAAACHRPRAAR